MNYQFFKKCYDFVKMYRNELACSCSTIMWYGKFWFKITTAIYNPTSDSTFESLNFVLWRIQCTEHSILFFKRNMLAGNQWSYLFVSLSRMYIYNTFVCISCKSSSKCIFLSFKKLYFYCMYGIFWVHVMKMYKKINHQHYKIDSNIWIDSESHPAINHFECWTFSIASGKK